METDWLKTILLATASGLIGAGLSILVVRKGERESVTTTTVWNAHLWHVIGLLSFILVCTLAVDWGSIPQLANILSFALGLASLLLALIAIVQSLTSSSSVDSTLASIKKVANGLLDTRKALDDAVVEIQRVNSRVLDETIVNRAQLEALGARMASSAQKSEPVEVEQVQAAPGEFDLTNGKVTQGGTLTIYALAKSLKYKRAFKPSDFGELAVTNNYMTGYISALSAFDIVKTESTDDKSTLATSLQGQEDAILANSRTFAFGSNRRRPLESFNRIDAFFDRGDRVTEGSNSNENS